MKFLALFALIAIIGTAQAIVWDALKVTWGVNPFGPAFADLPRTVRAAERARWTKVSACGDAGVPGERYVLKGDESVVLIFNVGGEIAGMATHVPKANVESAKFPQGNQLNYFDLQGDNYVMSAYFTDPELICEPGSTSTFNRLIIKTATSKFEVNTQESLVEDFTKGKCFWSMGQHFWAAKDSQVTTATKFADFFPGFLLYNKGKLTGFGFAGFGESKWMGTSKRYEHPDSKVIGQFMKEVPDFFYDKKTAQLATMHIYFTKNPRYNQC